MAQYIEHPALLGMRMGNQASQQRMQGYQQAVDRNTVAQIQAASQSQQRAYDLAKWRDFLKANINPISGQPYYGKPQDFGTEQERFTYAEQAGRQSRDPRTGKQLGYNQAPAWDVPYERSAQLALPGPVGPGFMPGNDLSPEQRQELIYNTAPQPEEPSWIDDAVSTIGGWFGYKPNKAQPARRQVEPLRD